MSKVKAQMTQVQNKLSHALNTTKHAIQNPRAILADTIRGYLRAQQAGTTTQYVNDLVTRSKEESKKNSNEENLILIPQLIFLNILGYDTTWGDFTVLEVMALDDYSAKHTAYIAAAQMWDSNSDAVLMATNRIYKDLTSNTALYSSAVLSSLSSFLTPTLSQSIFQNVISLMTSAKPYIRQKAITVFYHICLQYPEALKSGFVTLRTQLDDDDKSVVFSVLSVINELCYHNPRNFIPLIPKIFKMIDNTTDNWSLVRIISILTMLCSVEPRLIKKLIAPFTNILETTSSITVLFECVRSIISIPITNTVLLTYTAQRMQSFLEHVDVNLRYLCLTLFIKLMEIQPKLVAQHRELITECLDSTDEPTRMLALDLLSSLANSKTIDSIVAKMYDHFKSSSSTIFKNQIITRVIEICSKNDYALVTDFDWYITILMNFVAGSGITCYDLIADQFLDLALRVPSTRKRLVEEMASLFKYSRFRKENRLLLSASHIIGDYSEDISPFKQILSNNIQQMNERVQSSIISTCFKLYFKCKNEEQKHLLENSLKENIDQIFSNSKYAEVQDISSLIKSLIDLIKEDENNESYEELRAKFVHVDEEEEPEPIEVPDELNEPIDLFDDKEDDLKYIDEKHLEIDELLPKTTSKTSKTKASAKPKVKKLKKKIPRQSTTGERVVILKSHENLLSTNKSTNKNNQNKKATALSDALASVDFSATVAETEARVTNPQKIPFDQSLQEKRKAAIESKVITTNNGTKKVVKRVLRRKKQTQNENENNRNEEQQKEEQIQSKPGSRFVKLYEHFNDDQSKTLITFSALEFYPNLLNPKTLEIELYIENNMNYDIENFNIYQIIQKNEKENYLQTINSLKSKSKVTTKIIIDCENIDITKGNIINLRFTPSNDTIGVIEFPIKVFPSYFLVEGKEEEFENVINNLENVKEIDLKDKMNNNTNELLQIFVNVLRGKLIEKKEENLYYVYAKTTEGINLIAMLNENEKKLTLKSDNESLLGSIFQELQAKVNKMNQ
ncbi:Adaptin N terminal region family protein [Histomonas meleagridis]|uniref:Adaptin N terminal region family protein n=1 Tax=Histomonas meleagridis TaxID=135588 RepID=UPI00355A7F6C|nr:Adaptin N terminal region family protein [Histomonas meleagridis]KAH0799436.1 Adaptin N terminal region family protein [Histomonas meleagridis]